jgi:hypothetical protein
MAKTTPTFSFVALGLIASTLGCSPEVPSAPTYTKDVQPILAAHCVRCHDTAFTSVWDPISGTEKVPALCHLDSFDDAGDCSPAGVADRLCRVGARACAGMFHDRITSDLDTFRMPKPPSDPLDDWEVAVLDRWVGNPLQ